MDVPKDHEHTPDDSVEENLIPAACTKNGNYDEVVYCSECGEELYRETVVILSSGHTNGEPVQENIQSSCTESGSYDEVVYCTVCGDEISRIHKSSDPLGHHLVFVKLVNATY